MSLLACKTDQDCIPSNADESSAIQWLTRVRCFVGVDDEINNSNINVTEEWFGEVVGGSGLTFLARDCGCRTELGWRGDFCESNSEVSINGAVLLFIVLFIVLVLFVFRLSTLGSPLLSMLCFGTFTTQQKQGNHNAKNGSNSHDRGSIGFSLGKSLRSSFKARNSQTKGSCCCLSNSSNWDSRETILLLTLLSCYLCAPLALASGISLMFIGPPPIVNGEAGLVVYRLFTIPIYVQILTGFIAIFLLALSLVEIVNSMQRIKNFKWARYIILLLGVSIISAELALVILDLTFYASLLIMLVVIFFISFTIIGPGWLFYLLAAARIREKLALAHASTAIIPSNKATKLRSLRSCCRALWMDVILDIFACVPSNILDLPPQQDDQAQDEPPGGATKMTSSMKDIFTLARSTSDNALVVSSSPISSGGKGKASPIRNSEAIDDVLEGPLSLDGRKSGAHSRSDSKDTSHLVEVLNRTSQTAKGSKSSMNSEGRVSPPLPPRTRTASKGALGSKESGTSTRLERSNSKDSVGAKLERANSKGSVSSFPAVLDSMDSPNLRRGRSDSKDASNSHRSWKLAKIASEDRINKLKKRQERQNLYFARFLRRVLQLSVRMAFGMVVFVVFTMYLALTESDFEYPPAIFGEITSTMFCRAGQILSALFSIDSILWYFSDVLLRRKMREKSAAPGPGNNNNAAKTSVAPNAPVAPRVPVPGMLISVDSFRQNSIDSFKSSSKLQETKSFGKLSKSNLPPALGVVVSSANMSTSASSPGKHLQVQTKEHAGEDSLNVIIVDSLVHHDDDEHFDDDDDHQQSPNLKQ